MGVGEKTTLTLAFKNLITYFRENTMERSKLVAIITGAISVLLAIAYLIIVQILDYRDMQPAPIMQIILDLGISH
jgi:hypothetical protein